MSRGRREIHLRSDYRHRDVSPPWPREILMLSKVLIANRGEIACRVIRGCRELGIKSVAIFSEVDRESLHVKLADEAICVGAGSNSDSYLNLANVLMACQISGAEAVHPGYGYFSERSSFAAALNSLGIIFIGPPIA